MTWSTFEAAKPPVIHLGPGARAALARLEGSAALVTTRSLLEVAPELGLEPVVTVTISQHAPESEIDKGVEAVAGAAVGTIVSFGGGSPIDAAKIIALRRGGAPPPHVAVATTLSGAELAAGAGMTDAAGSKVGLRDPRGLPAAVIYDPELALRTPLDLWLSTGIRALDHACEGVLAPGDHPLGDALCLEGGRRLLRTLPAAKRAPEDGGVRQDNYVAGWFAYSLPAAAGGLSHVMGKQVGARHGIPHGVTSCILLPHVLRYRARCEPERMALLREGLGGDPAELVGDLVAELGQPQRLSTYGLRDEDLRAAAAGVAGTYPEDELLEVYRAAL